MFAATKYNFNKTRTRPRSKSGGEKKPKPLCQHRLQLSQSAPADDASSNERTSLKTEDQSILPQSASQDGPCHLCQQQRRHDRIYRWKLICGLTLPFILSTLDLTIVATAVPTIASHFSTSFRSPIHFHRVPTDVYRQIRPTQLDRHSIHTNLNNIHPHLRPARRRIRQACGAPARHVAHAGGEYAVRGGAELGDAFAGEGAAGDGLGGDYEYHYDCLGGSGFAERECEE
jgi:hypothetical protein